MASVERRAHPAPGVVVDAFDVEREVIGQRQFLEQADQEKRKAVGEILQAEGRGVMELRQQVSGPLDRAGHQLREEADEGGEAEEVALALRRCPDKSRWCSSSTGR